MRRWIMGGFDINFLGGGFEGGVKVGDKLLLLLLFSTQLLSTPCGISCSLLLKT